MFEVIYISPSCKQAVFFIHNLAEKLKSLGITDFEMDEKNMRLKTVNVIVSAIDIWGGQLGRSHSMTKYYIDDLSSDDFQNEGVIEKWKFLKRTFREGTQRINEEELIEILAEG